MEQSYADIADLSINNNGSLVAVSYYDDSLQIEDLIYRDKLSYHNIHFSPDNKNYVLAYENEGSAYLEYKNKLFGPAFTFKGLQFNRQSLEAAFISVISEKNFVHYLREKSPPLDVLYAYTFRGKDLIYGDYSQYYCNHQNFQFDYVFNYPRHDFSEDFQHYIAAFRDEKDWVIISDGKALARLKKCPDNVAISRDGKHSAWAMLDEAGILKVKNAFYSTGIPVTDYESWLRFNNDASAWIFLYQYPSYKDKSKTFFKLYTEKKQEKGILLDDFNFLHDPQSMDRYNLAYSFKKNKKEITRINKRSYSFFLKETDISFSQNREHCGFWRKDTKTMYIDDKTYPLNKGLSSPDTEAGRVIPPCFSADGSVYGFSYFVMEKGRKNGQYIMINNKHYGPFVQAAFSISPEGVAYLTWIEKNKVLIKKLH